MLQVSFENGESYKMSNDVVFYRGSGKYLDSVKEQLSDMEASGVRNTETLMSRMYDMEYGIRSDIRENTYATVASQAYLAQGFNQNFNVMNNSLNVGFSVLAEGFNQNFNI